MWKQPKSDIRQLGPSVPNLLCDVGSPVLSLELRFFIYQKQRGQFDKMALRILWHCGFQSWADGERQLEFRASLPEQGQERQVVWWLFQAENWRPSLSAQ